MFLQEVERKYYSIYKSFKVQQTFIIAIVLHISCNAIKDFLMTPALTSHQLTPNWSFLIFSNCALSGRDIDILYTAKF